MSHASLSIQNAQRILNDYGSLLSTTEPSIYGLSQALLPHDKEHIKAAIQTILHEGGTMEQTLRNSLIEAYVFLAHFITEEDARFIEQAQSGLELDHPDRINLEQSRRASQIINTIKLEMEALLAEVELFTSTTDIKR